MESNQLIIFAAVVLGLFIVFRIVKTMTRISPKKALKLQENGAFHH